ncbi:MAG: ATP-binding protein [Halobacteriales archaeon]|nr:ATP-binding protein [Halobacteriales archaeon]
MKSIEIENFRSIREVEAHNLNDVNVFYGKNNSGKSNILRSIKFLSQSSEGPYFDTDLGDFETSVYKEETERVMGFSGSFDFTEAEVAELEKLLEGSEYEGLNWEIPYFHIEIAEDQNGYTYTKKFEIKDTTRDNLVAKRTQDESGGSEWEFYNGGNQGGGGSNDIWDYEFPGDLGYTQEVIMTILKNMKRKIENVDYLHPNRSIPNRSQSIDSMRDISETGKNIHNRLTYLYNRNREKYDEIKYRVDKLGLGELSRDLSDEGIAKIRLRDPVLDTETNIRDVGFGTQQILSFVTLGFLPETGTILIEEPERSLHPIAQRELVDLLEEMTENGKQIFLTTHSSALLGRLRDDSRLDEIVSVYKVTKTEENPAGTKCDVHSSVEEISMEGIIGTTD